MKKANDSGITEGSRLTHRAAARARPPKWLSSAASTWVSPPRSRYENEAYKRAGQHSQLNRRAAGKAPLFVTGDLSLGKNRGVLGSRVQTKIIRAAHLDPWCRGRSRWTTSENRFWPAIDRDINLPRGAISRIPCYGRTTDSVADQHWIWRCLDRCGGCCGTAGRHSRVF